jgi:hypothetical protein
MFSFPKSMQKIFKVDDLQLSFEKNGFVIVDFYNSTQIEELNLLYKNLHPQDEIGFFPSTFSSDRNYRLQADLNIRKISSPRMEELFVDYQEVCGSFIVKSPNPNSGMCVHQDMSLVDESRFTGVNIWTPLIDLTVENGTIFVLPGSHRFFPTYRGSSIPEFFSPVMDEIIDFLHPVIISAGKAVIFDQSIIHFSPPNYSNQTRIVTNIFITNHNSQFKTFYWDKSQKTIEEYDQDKSFMTDFEQFGNNIHNRPTVGNYLRNVEYDFPIINSDFLRNNCTPTNARALLKEESEKYKSSLEKKEKKPSFLSKLFGR